MLFRALLAFLVLPGILAGIVPALIAAFDPWKGGIWWPGALVLGVGAMILLWCIRDLYVSGKGTLAPWAPPRELVVVGLYRLLRNPMYVGVLTVVAGWSALFRSPLEAAYTLVLATGFHWRVVRKEEPWLAETFGEEWEVYRREVSRWWPMGGLWTK